MTFLELRMLEAPSINPNDRIASALEDESVVWACHGSSQKKKPGLWGHASPVHWCDHVVKNAAGRMFICEGWSPRWWRLA
jgi:hypothetical protein